MKETITIKAGCGCEKKETLVWDGRKKAVTCWLTPDERAAEGIGEDVAVYKIHPRRLAEIILRRGYPATEKCIRCLRKDKQALAMACGFSADAAAIVQWFWSDSLIRAIGRVIRKTGGSLSQSPKSSSLYVTWATGAWRVSDHGWYGCPQSCLRQKHMRRYRWFFARLTPNWLQVELAG